ncbi:hypothetical protein B0H21DRAFT_363927 [Amylocystis lapponica]|nr:hypothetical protein B0H21DRAFT_363927 [Amylocystis lapponica]
MSTWGIGDNHDSDQVSILKDQLRSKDAQYATLHSQLCKKDDELNEVKASFNDMLYKLRNEADRVVQLETTLNRRNEELQNERLTRQNTEGALTAAHQKFKSQEQTTRELNVHLESLSSHANNSSSDKAKLERDNAALQARVRELQLEAQAKEQREQAFLRHSQSAAANSSTTRGGRRRSSSVSTFRVTALEHEASDLRTLSGQQSSEIRVLTERLAHAQQALVQAENEKMATERRLHRQLEEVQASLEEREEDLKAMRQMGEGADVAMREAGLLERLEDEEGRVAALETQLAHANANHRREATMLTNELERMQQLLADEKKKVLESEPRMIDLISEKEEAFDEREQAQRDVLDLKKRMDSAKLQIQDLESKLAASTPLPHSPTRFRKPRSRDGSHCAASSRRNRAPARRTGWTTRGTRCAEP